MCFNVARMFVQVTQCKHGSATYFTYLVRESFRTPKGPRSRTICNITALPPETRELISQSLQGRSFVAAESLQLTEAWNCGGLVVLHQTQQDFVCRATFDPSADPRRPGLPKANDRTQAKLLPSLVQDHQPTAIPGFGQLQRLCSHKAAPLKGLADKL